MSAPLPRNATRHTAIQPLAPPPRPPSVKVIWDLDSCPIPGTCHPVSVVRSLHRFAASLGTLQNITCFSSKITVPLQRELSASSVLLSISSSPVSDVVIATEMLKIVCDYSVPCKIVLIMGDRPDLCAPFEVVSMRGYDVFLLHSRETSSALLLSATKSIEWNVFVGAAKPSMLNLLTKPTSFKGLNTSGSSTNARSSPCRVIPPPPTTTASPSRVVPPPSHPSPSPSTSSPSASLSPIPQALVPPVPSSTTQNDTRPVSPVSEQHSSSQETVACVPTFPMYQPSNAVAYSPVGAMVYEGAQVFFSLLPTALHQLKRQYFTPTETAIKGALKSLQRNRTHKITLTPAIWEETVALAHQANYVIVGKPPKRVIYMASDCFEGVDPDHPETDFPSEIWDALSRFLRDTSPGKKNGRFGFAECLSCKGPDIIRELPLGKICELVQQAIMRKVLEFSKGFVGVSEHLVDSHPNTIDTSKENGTAVLVSPRTNVTRTAAGEVDPSDDNAVMILSLLPTALDTLQEDMLKPYEQVVQARIRQLAENTKLSFKKKHWASVLTSATLQGFVISDTSLGKLIYSPRGPFHGVDPRHPQSRFEGYVWNALQAFLVSIHPLRYPLRYQFATFLKKEGPPQLQVLPLGIISELVEAAISRGYLRRLDPKTIATTDFIPSYSSEGDLHLALSAPLRAKEDAVVVLQLVCERFLPSWPLPIFVVVDCSGPPHSPTYCVIAVLLNVIIGEGEGPSKMEGHANAAYRALSQPSSQLHQILQLFLSEAAYGDLSLFLSSLDAEFALPPRDQSLEGPLDPATVSLPKSTYNWFYVASIIRNLSDQPSPENVGLAVRMIEKFLTMHQFVPLPGLVNAIVTNVHLHYLREFQVTLIERLAEVVNPLNHWAIESGILDHYPLLPEASLKILFVNGNMGKVATLLHTYKQYDQPLSLEWLVNALPQSHPNPAHCVLKLCRTHLHTDQSTEQSDTILQLLDAYEQIRYRITNRDRQYASQILSEWERRQLHSREVCERFARLFHVFSPHQSIQPSSAHPARVHSVTFRWENGGQSIKLAGSFNEWTEYIPLTADVHSGGVPQVILDLPEGVHQYKFIVDGEWQCDPMAPLLVEPLSGYKNNYVQVGART